VYLSVGGCTDPQYWSVRSERPSSAVCCLCVCQRCLPELPGSAGGKRTPRGWKKLRREGGSCIDTHTHTHTHTHRVDNIPAEFVLPSKHLLTIIIIFISSHLPLESVVLTIVVPMESINISATPSLSLILKYTHTHTVTYLQTHGDRHENVNRHTSSYTAQCRGLKELPLIFLNTSWSNSTSTQASYPRETKGRT